MATRSIIGIVLGFGIMAGAYFLLIAQDRFSEPEQFSGLEFIEPDSPQGEVVEIINQYIRPRQISNFVMDDRIVAVRFPVAQNALMGRIDLDYSNYEVIQISCALRDAGLTEYSFEYVLTMLGEDEEENEVVLDGIGVRLEEETINELDCSDTQALRLDAIADDYTLIYLEDETAQ